MTETSQPLIVEGLTGLPCLPWAKETKSWETPEARKWEALWVYSSRALTGQDREPAKASKLIVLSILSAEGTLGVNTSLCFKEANPDRIIVKGGLLSKAASSEARAAEETATRKTVLSRTSLN